MGILFSTDTAQSIVIAFGESSDTAGCVGLKTVNEPLYMGVETYGDMIKGEVHVTCGGVLTLYIIDIVET